MSKSLILTESQQKYQTLKQYLAQSSDTVHLELLESDVSDLLHSMYWNNGSPVVMDSTSLDTLAAALDTYHTIYMATAPGVAGDFLAQHWADALGLTNGKLQRLSLPILAPAVLKSFLKKNSADPPRLAVLDELRRLDQLVDGSVRPLFNASENLPLLGMVPWIALFLISVFQKETSLPNNSLDIFSTFGGQTQQLHSRLEAINDNAITFSDRNVAKATIIDVKEHKFHIQTIQKNRHVESPPQPFNSASLLSAAFTYLGFSVETTLNTALSLYNGLDIGLKKPAGLISYPFTGSFTVPLDEVTCIREYILVNFGTAYLPQRSDPDNDPESPGAIRPAIPLRAPRKVKKFLSTEQYQLYKLIWNRTLASFMTPVVRESGTIKIVDQEQARYRFIVEEQQIVQRGFLQAWDANPSPNSRWSAEEWQPRQELKLESVELKRAPQRHSSLSVGDLLQQIDELDIAFPETLPWIPEVLQAWEFINLDRGLVSIAQAGFDALNLVNARFPEVLNIQLARKIKQNLLHHATGKTPSDVVSDVQKLLEYAAQEEAAARSQRVQTREKTDRLCPICGGTMYLNQGQQGRYLSCEFYPERCQYIKSVDVHTHQFHGMCDKCGSDLTVKIGRYGRFLACTAFPKCNFTKPFPIGVKCPKAGCEGNVVERITRQGKTFYGCSRYPQCRFAAWQKPVNMACPECGSLYMVVAKLSSEGEKTVKCPECKKEFPLSSNSLREEG